MHPFRDFDAPLLLATMMASKRRPAPLVDIMAAVDLITENAIPTPQKLLDAFVRLSTHGVIVESAEGYTLSAEGQKLVAGLPKKADFEARVFSIKHDLSVCGLAGGQPAATLTAEQIAAAVAAHRAGRTLRGKNMLMPKTKADEATSKRTDQWRKAAARRRRENPR